MSSLNFVFTGFPDLDRATGGLWTGDLIVIAGSPCMGKSALSLNISEHVAVEESLPVAFFSMEKSAGQLAARLVGAMGRIQLDHLRSGKLTEHEWPRYYKATEKLRSIQLHLEESCELTVGELGAEARLIAGQRGKLGMMVVDSMQCMRATMHNGVAKSPDFGDIASKLKLLAIELRCPIIVLLQLRQSVETRMDKRPTLSDLSDFGAVEEHADIVLLLYRDQYYTKAACEQPGVAEITIAKQRNGPTGTLKLAFLEPIACFESLACCDG